ncbi:MAG: transcription antitermination factor NusB, partial [Paracraurococcus sp.]
MAAPTQNPARRAAALLLDAVLLRHRPLEEALDALPTDGRPHRVREKGEARPGAAVSPRDKAAAHRIAAAVLRRAGSLDAVLEPFLRREPPGPVRNVLRIGAAELLLLGTPAHAAVGSAVDLVPKPFAGLVNAVLRRVAEAGPAALEGLEAERLDTPAWLWIAWHAAYGAA